MNKNERKHIQLALQKASAYDGMSKEDAVAILCNVLGYDYDKFRDYISTHKTFYFDYDDIEEIKSKQKLTYFKKD